MGLPKSSLVVTFINEEKSIDTLLTSVLKQSVLPDELILVDGGSRDKTIQKINNLLPLLKQKINRVLVFVKKGNRSVGRNEGIKRAQGSIILSTDAGCVLKENWIEKILIPFKNKSVDVVAGYYSSKPKNIFEKCVVAYTLVMPDKLNNSFLPSTRSMAFKKSIWKKINGFPIKFSHNEDYVFAHTLKKRKANIVVQKDAIVYWSPRSTIKSTFVMFSRFALGDVESRIIRPKAVFLFARYFFAAYLIGISLLMRSFSPLIVLTSLVLIYIAWSIKKNYKYIQDIKAFFYLPFFQLLADGAVLSGSVLGLGKIAYKKRNIFQDKLLILIISVYSLVMLSVISWGIPGEKHPFTYHMDEWHQLQAVKSLFSKGTVNIEGSAHGSMFHFFISGLLLIPFIVIGFVNPAQIHSSVTELSIQHNLFLTLRIQTILFGILTIIVVWKIIKDFLKTSPFIPMIFFVFSPIFLSLSNYFKYDIGLLFWISLSFYGLLMFLRKQTIFYFLVSGLLIGIALSVKVSAIPLIPIYLTSFLMSSMRNRKKILFFGFVTIITIFLLIGIPDIFFSRGDYKEFLYSNLIEGPMRENTHYYLGTSILWYMITKHFPIIFGHGAYILYVISLFFVLIKFLKNKSYERFFLISFIFFSASLIPLGLYVVGNRILVLLPFFSIFLALFLKYVYRSYPRILRFLILVLVIFQITESSIWIEMKLYSSSQEKSSSWIYQNIPRKAEIGIENIPIYQMLPDSILKDFYTKQYFSNRDSLYKYKIINAQTTLLPKYVIVSNDVLTNYEVSSSKKELIERLQKDEYKKIVSFRPQVDHFNYIGIPLDYYLSSLVIMPYSLSVYEK